MLFAAKVCNYSLNFSQIESQYGKLKLGSHVYSFLYATLEIS